MGAVNNVFKLKDRQKAERKYLITVAEWESNSDNAITIDVDGTGSGTATKKVCREILGTRTEDSSIEYNADIATSTDIRGITYTDINSTQPQQDFDPYLVLGGSDLGAYLNDIRRRNALSELNAFTIYIITAYINDNDLEDVQSGTAKIEDATAYACERHTDCTIAYTALGGDAYVNMPISLYLSNVDNTSPETQKQGHASIGTVDSLAYNFVFTPNVNV